MLLRSITKHVREQNWFAVGLDFFIVVAGILIAFQITNWNEARSEAKLKLYYLERLQSDLTETSDYLSKRQTQAEMVLENINQFIGILNNPGTEDVDLVLITTEYFTRGTDPRQSHRQSGKAA